MNITRGSPLAQTDLAHGWRPTSPLTRDARAGYIGDAISLSLQDLTERPLRSLARTHGPPYARPGPEDHCLLRDHLEFRRVDHHLPIHVHRIAGDRDRMGNMREEFRVVVFRQAASDLIDLPVRREHG